MIDNEYITKLDRGDMNRMWLTSDTHWSHSNILKYCVRPWDTVEEMNQALIDNWNSVVGPDDHVYHLGDFCFGNVEKWNAILEPGVLNGHIHLILGNHDPTRLYRNGVHIGRFSEITYQKLLFVDGWTVYLNHFPFLDFSNNIDYKTCQFYGHTHENPFTTGTMNNERLSMVQWNQYNVGVDNNNYTPISWSDAIGKIIEKRDVLSDNNESKLSD